MTIPPHQDLWNKIYKDVEEQVSPVAFETWISKLVPIELTNTSFILSAPDDVAKQTMDGRYISKIISAIKQKTGRNLDVEIILDPMAYPKNTDTTKHSVKTVTNTTILPRYTFKTFVKGKSNELAFEASCAVAESPGRTSYNPLYLYGGVGLGKTHLMHSIGNYILEFDPYQKIIYTTSENLVNDFVFAIRNREDKQFREKYRNVDVLMVDDVQFLIEKERSQEEFFHTFNALYFANKQIVLSSDRLPSELKTLEERLTSRFGSGLVVDITRPDYETRLAILENKAEKESIPIPIEVLQHLAQSIASNIRELEGVFTKVVAQAKLTKSNINVEMAEKIVNDMNNAAERRELDIHLIIEFAAAHYNFTIEEIKSKKRTAPLAQARHVAMFLARKIMNDRLTSIGKDFGGRDHSTVINAYNKINEQIEKNAPFLNELDELESKIRDAAK